MRLANRVLGALLSLAVMVAGVLLIVEVIASRSGHRAVLVHWTAAYDWARRTTWTAGSVRVTGGLLIVLGLILLIAELKPARVKRLVTEPTATGTDIDTAYTRRGLAAAIRSAAVAVDGVRGASVTVRRRKIVVAATATARDRAVARRLAEPVAAAAGQRLAALRLRREPSISVHVRPGSR